MARVEHVKANKDYPAHGIKKGEMYYKWSFRFGGSFKSKTPPKRQQLTQSDFLIALYDIEDSIEAMEDVEEIEDIISEIESLADEQEDKLSNMPEGLQEGDTGQLLQERADGLRDWAQELESIDAEIDEEAITEDAWESQQENLLDSPDWDPDDDEFKESVDERVAEEIEERKNEILDEIRNTSHSL